MKRVIIIQARMGSNRLPGKVLMDVAGRPMLAQQIRRLRECAMADEICVATTAQESDRPIVELVRGEGVRWFCGEENDVLRRMARAAVDCAADVVVRLTADCPLVDPGTTDRVIRELVDHAAECDYASNVLKRTFPRGLDVEAMHRDTLERMDRMAAPGPDREHVTTFARATRPDLFLLRNVADAQDNSDLRWTVDRQEDLDMVRAIFLGLGLGDRRVDYREVLAYVRNSPALATMNRGGQTWDPLGHKNL